MVRVCGAELHKGLLFLSQLCYSQAKQKSLLHLVHQPTLPQLPVWLLASENWKLSPPLQAKEAKSPALQKSVYHVPLQPLLRWS